MSAIHNAVLNIRVISRLYDTCN